jgi:(2Fe-2S) ferredoxin
MYWTKRHVLVCTASHCAQKGANDVVGKLRLDVVRKGLDTDILVNTCGTIDLCDIGPNMIVYPDNVILSGVKVKDLPDVIEYLKGGPVPDHLVLRPRAGAEEQRRSFYQETWILGPTRVEPEFAALAEQRGFDSTWMSEQLRRGFIARKADETGATITVTKKARDRYGLANSDDQVNE